MTPNARNANKRKAESPLPDTGGTASIANPARSHHKKQKHAADEPAGLSSSPGAAIKPTPVPSGIKKHMLSLLQTLQNAVDDTGRLIASDFIELPSRKRYPDYFVTIKKPIAFDMISARLENDEYDDIEALKADITLMTSNAKKYNVKESSIFQDAVVLQKMAKDFPNEPPQTLKVTLRQPPPREKAASVSRPVKQTAAQAQEELLVRLENLKEPRTKRKYSDIFMDAPSKKEYPEYYEFIQRVICLNEIKRNVQRGVYKSWAEFEADVELVWSNAFTFNEDGSQVYEDAKKLKTEFETALREKKAALGEPSDTHLKLKFNLHQPTQTFPSTKIKLHMSPQQKISTPPAPSPPSTGTAPPPVKRGSPILAPQPLPPRPAQQVRQSSPLKNQITSSPSKSPPALRPAPAKPGSAPTLAPNQQQEWNVQQPTIQPQQQNRPPLAQAPIARPSPSQQIQPNARTSQPQENGIRHHHGSTQPSPMASILHGAKKERSLTLIPLVTLTTPPTQLNSPSISAKSSTSSSPQPTTPQAGLLLQIPSPAPPAPATQTICLTVPRDCPEVILNAYMTKDLSLHGSYTFSVVANGRKIPPSIWPDASRRSGTVGGAADSISVLPQQPATQQPPCNGLALNAKEWGDHWKFTISLGEAGSITSVEAGCTAFLKRDERGLLVRGERSRTGIAAGEDGGEVERVVLLVLRGR